MNTRKLTDIFPVTLISGLLFAATHTMAGMTEEQMQQMMEQAQKMQECMAKIDESGMEALGAKAEAMEREVKALCDAGKRDQAQKQAIKYGKEISAAPEMKQLQKCGEMAKGMMQHSPMMSMEELESRHVCDDM